MIGLLLAVLSLSLAAGCTRATQQEEDTVTASILIQEKDLLPDDSGQGRHSALGIVHQDFAFSDVQSIKISVTDQSTTPGTKFLVNFDLLKASPPLTGWSARIPSLPKNKPLYFEAVAYSSPVALEGNKLFVGSTQQTFTDNGSILIVLKPQNSGPILLPRILLVSGPQSFTTGQPDNISFVLEADTGATLSYAVTPDASVASPGAGTFYPAGGSFTLSGTSGTVVSQYQPPTVSTSTVFTHKVTVTNKAGHSVTTTFKTTVLPPGRTDTVDNTGVSVSFAPVINALGASRAEGSSDVVFTASVTDDTDEGQLKYAWSFTPNGTYSPVPTMDGSTTRVSTLSNYNQNVQGTLTLTVTDLSDNATTLNYVINKNQFLDSTSATGQSTDINSIRAGDNHTCALFNNGVLRCWGLGSFGALGYGGTANLGNDPANPISTTAVPVPFSGKAVKVATGWNHTCVLLDTGYIACWGYNQYGQLGYNTQGVTGTDRIGDNEPISGFGFVNVGGLATKIAAGQNHTCALMITGRVRCWGDNQYGQLGYGNTATKPTIGINEAPSDDVQLGDASGYTATDIVAGGNHTCALLNSGAVRCWGYGGLGALGLGNFNTVGDTKSPYASGGVVNLGTNGASQIAAGANHTCAIIAQTGKLKCWGYNPSGQLGNGTSGCSSNSTTCSSNNSYLTNSPGADIAVGGRTIQVVAGNNHTCALLESGSVKCWGNANVLQTGLGTATQTNAPSASVDFAGTTAFQITAGNNHTCALLSTGAARCWGYNEYGQLGYNLTANSIGNTRNDIKFAAP